MAERRTNRLSAETSPYLLQHQHNPVDWYAWGDEAFERARTEDRPILLSIGYSSCHWCHVMEHESFEDEQTAAIMNDRFVNIKVDREERPDVDSLYMTAVQRLTGHGGWPMTVFVTPDGEPFYGGTYFPPQPRHGLPSFQQLLLGISEAWRERREEVRRSAEELTSMLREAAALRPQPGTLDPAVLDGAAEEIVRGHDRRFGGFGAAPKFPQPLTLEFLLRHWSRTGGEEELQAVVHTLRWMARGGIYDHVGGGFHRYSVDAKWLVPHFEKMLYDNALLSRVYLNAYLVTAEEEFRETVEATLDYVLREMRSQQGGFYSAQDADSEGEEGKFYVWRPEEIDAALGAEEGGRLRRAYGVTEEGNFEGSNILNLLPRGGDVPAEGWDADVAAAREEMCAARDRLYAARARRIPPGLDDKILTAWNAMMIRSFAEGGRALKRADYVEAAVTGASFLRRELWRESALLRTHRAGISKMPAFLDDHALLVDALVSLYQATFDPQWISWAREIAGSMLDRFWSEEEGHFYDAAADSADLVVRPREMNDSATPSGTSAAATSLLRLGALTGEARYAAVVEAVLAPLGEVARRFPQAFGELLTAIDLQLNGMDEVAIVGRSGGEDTDALLEALQGRYLPATVTAFHPVDDGDESVPEIPLLEGRTLVDGAAAAYACRQFACRRPVTNPDDLLRELGVERSPR